MRVFNNITRSIRSSPTTRSRLAGIIKGLFPHQALSKSINRLRYCSLFQRSGLMELVGRLKTTGLWIANCKWQITNRNRRQAALQPDLQVLNCRVRLTKQQPRDLAETPKNNANSDAFAIEICGTIHAPSDMQHTNLRISMVDITDGPLKAIPVKAIGELQTADGQFIHHTDLGKLPNPVTTISDWTTVARIPTNRLWFPGKGERSLLIYSSVLSRKTGEELARAQCTFTYENSELGHISLQEDIQQTKILAVALAFVVSAADKKLYNCETELIKNWAKGNIGAARASNRAKRKLDKAIDKTIVFFRKGGQLNGSKICRKIVEIAPIAVRYDILELCIHVARAKGFATAEELAVLKNLANWLKVDTDRFREMTERILPVNIHKVKNIEVILGVTSDMSTEQTRQQLNKLFAKWNARVTNSDPAIRTQADQMLKLIAEARSQYVG